LNACGRVFFRHQYAQYPGGNPSTPALRRVRASVIVWQLPAFHCAHTPSTDLDRSNLGGALIHRDHWQFALILEKTYN
jgi:hypothetical protein